MIAEHGHAGQGSVRRVAGFQGMVMASTCACFKADDLWTKRGRATGGTAGDQTGSKHHTLVQGWPRWHMQQQTVTRAAARAEHDNVRYSGNDTRIAAALIAAQRAAAEREQRGGVG